MNRLVPFAAVLCLAGAAACSDRDDDVVQAGSYRSHAKRR